MFGELGRAPRRGDVVTIAGVEFAVEQVEGPRIEKLLVRLPPREIASAEPGGAAGLAPTPAARPAGRA